MIEVGYELSSGFVLEKKIESLDEFYTVMITEKSIYARHRMYPAAFFYSWPIKLIKEWIDAGRFFIAHKQQIQNN